MSIALKLVTLALMPLSVLVMMPAEEASARGRGGGGAGFSKPHGGGGGHRHHGHSHGSRSSFGFFFGATAFSPWWYGPGPWYWPLDYPATYVEQDGYWYYCPAVQAYYPYVTECPGAEWQRVDPTPPPG